MDNKWLMFKNYMHNELGITKEDIRQWIEESVQVEAEKMVSNEFGKFSAYDTVKKMVMDNKYYGSDTLKKEVMQEVSRQLVDKINLKLK